MGIIRNEFILVGGDFAQNQKCSGQEVDRREKEKTGLKIAEYFWLVFIYST